MDCFGESKKLLMIRSMVVTEQLDSMKFELYVNGYKASRILSGNDFLEWLNVYNIDSIEYTKEQARKGIEIEVPEGVAMWISIN